MTTISEKKLLKLGQDFKKVKEENEKLKEKYETFRVRNCDRMEELVKALSPWKKNNQDHKRILEAIVELKQENEELKEENQKLLRKYLFREIRIDKLIKENIELEQENKMQSYQEGYLEHEMKQLHDENVKLIEEIKLKDEIIKLHETS